jgi:hypothetical protein
MRLANPRPGVVVAITPGTEVIGTGMAMPHVPYFIGNNANIGSVLREKSPLTLSLGGSTSGCHRHVHSTSRTGMTYSL